MEKVPKLEPKLELVGDDYVVSDIGDYIVSYLALDDESQNFLLLLQGKNPKDYRLCVGSAEKGLTECKITDVDLYEDKELDTLLGLPEHPSLPGIGLLTVPKEIGRLPTLSSVGGKRSLKLKRFRIK
ncbi:MAG TPA: hypothetical protein VK254_01300 [Candidatus Bathyarchaeia archaeon]|nr:hypothetical protein [Candidatus Bathyarchaeia archaeon]